MDDLTKTRLDLYTSLNGYEDISALNIIDTVLGEHRDSIEILKTNPSISPVHCTYAFSNLYTGTIDGMTEYKKNSMIALSLAESNSDVVIVNINDIGSISCLKYNTTGELVNMEPGDMLANIPYLFIYNGTAYVYVGYNVQQDLKTALNNSGKYTETINSTQSEVAEIVLEDFELFDGVLLRIKLNSVLLPNAKIKINELDPIDIYTCNNNATIASYSIGSILFLTYNAVLDKFCLINDTADAFKSLNDHINDQSNSHKVTKAQIGLNNVPNVIPYHEGNKPTKADVGLGNVDNTSDLGKPISTATQAALDSKLNAGVYTAADVLNKIKTVDGTGSGLDADLLDGRNAANAANSIPILDATGKLPVAQIPTGATASTVSLGNHGHSNYAASSHSHSYLPLTGGTVNGTTNFTSALRKSGLDVANYTAPSSFTPILGSVDGAGTLYSCTYNIHYNHSYYHRVGNLVHVVIYMKVGITAEGGTNVYEAIIRNLPYMPAGAIFAPAFITGTMRPFWSMDKFPSNTPFMAQHESNGYIKLRTASGVNATTWGKTDNAWIWLSFSYTRNY